MGEVIGYARVSSTGQNLEVQLEKLSNAGCTKVFQEKVSGLDSSREQLKQCLNYLREGDTLVITKLDRLARSTLDLHKIKQQLEDKNVELVVIDQGLDTSTATGRLMFSMLASIAEFETELRKERQADGIARAKENGVVLGKPAKLDEEQINQLKQDREAGVTIKNLMSKYNLGKTSVYKYLKDNSND